MPIPEPAIDRPSNLNKKQRQQELAAVYGVSMPMTEISPQEAEQMRQILSRYDAEAKPNQTFDLNAPPREPYRHQKFPMMVYDHGRSHPARDEEQQVVRGAAVVLEMVHLPAKLVTRLVHSEKELKAALEGGWSEEAPEFREERVEPLSAQYQAEAEHTQEQLDATNRRRRHKDAE